METWNENNKISFKIFGLGFTKSKTLSLYFLMVECFIWSHQYYKIIFKIRPT